jgi:NTE family protein
MDLYMTATCVTARDEQSRVLSHAHSPELPVCEAVRMSVSIPLLYTAVSHADDLWVDGGVLWNYPIDLFDQPEYGAVETAPGVYFNHHTLGLKVVSDPGPQSGTRAYQATRPDHAPVTNLKEFVIALVDAVHEQAEQVHVHARDWERTIPIDSLNVSATDFARLAREPELIDALLTSGERGVDAYFGTRREPTAQD